MGVCNHILAQRIKIKMVLNGLLEVLLLIQMETENLFLVVLMLIVIMAVLLQI